MRYLLLIPSSIAMLGSVSFYLLWAGYRWGWRRGSVMIAVAASLQFAGVWIAGRI